MIPSRLVITSNLPTMPSGKIDRLALRELDVAEPGEPEPPDPRRSAAPLAVEHLDPSWHAGDGHFGELLRSGGRFVAGGSDVHGNREMPG